MEWTGWVPFEELPHAYDPPDHAIVTANHRPAPASYAHLIGLEFPEPYRAARLNDLLRIDRKLSVEDFRQFQADTLSPHARMLLPLLLQHVSTDDPRLAPALDLVRRWDHDARGDSAAAAVFQAWFLALAPALAGDELGPRALEGYQGRFSYVTRFVAATLSQGESDWCDDVTTQLRRESCRDTVTRALQAGLTTMSEALGGDPMRWRWDRAHRAVFPHQGLDAVRLLRPLLSRSVPAAGDWSTVNVGPVNTDQPFDQTEIPGYRQIIDLSPANDSRFSDSVGQSGHFLSRHYDDALEDWRAVRHRRMRTNRGEIEQGAVGTLTLRPR
jgi:penicillin amidase